MRTDIPQPVRLADYRPPAFLIDEVSLDFTLDPHATRVKARLRVRRNGDHQEPLRLDGERLKTIAIAIDGRLVEDEACRIGEEGLEIVGVPDAFVLETEVEIDPADNKALDGLYMSGGRYCTQCEAEGFRKITFWPDRPDVLSRFTVRVEAEASLERLLSNGNLVESGALAGGRHFAVWNDPFPKPCYLFALVAGELDVLEDSFVTMNGRAVTLRIYVDPGMAPRAAYAMDSLKRAMRWDEEAFGREYDLDLFMIVAVRDFNAGAMENKGLNIFNSSLLLADPATATDFDYERIEGVVAHEYFHNWTGNRITCRDWFQLCLKEGLTVFRDQAFSADQRGEAVQRIKEVRALRARQFAEDASPIAHPVRPSQYEKIDNFYTATIYEKGAEVIRMLKTIIGDDSFRRGMDLYFERWDGHATTVEAFIACFAETSGRDLSAFFAWYEQAGTPPGRHRGRLGRGGRGPGPRPHAANRFYARPTRKARPAHPDRLRASGRRWTRDAGDEGRGPRDGRASAEARRRGRAAGRLRASGLFGPGDADDRGAAQGRLRPDGRRSGSLQPLGGGTVSGQGADPVPGGRQPGRRRRRALRRSAGESPGGPVGGSGVQGSATGPAVGIRSGRALAACGPGGHPRRPRRASDAHRRPSRRPAAPPARRPPGRRRILGERGGRGAQVAAQRGHRHARGRRPSSRPRPGEGTFRLRRKHDRHHGGPERPDAPGRAGGGGGARGLLRTLARRAAGDRQVVRDPGRQTPGKARSAASWG